MSNRLSSKIADRVEPDDDNDDFIPSNGIIIGLSVSFLLYSLLGLALFMP